MRYTKHMSEITPELSSLLWCSKITLTEDERRLIGFWAANCAERVLPLFEAKALYESIWCLERGS